ncbi:MAG: glycosyltransferase [Acidimicrobiales bacterium]
MQLWLILIGETVILIGCGYIAVTWLAGLRELKRRGVRLGDQARLGWGSPHVGRSDDYFVYYMIPCLNEEGVIGTTLAALEGDAAATVVVIDDASDDATGRIARSTDPYAIDVVVLRRELPDARQGKGAALNAGLAAVRGLAAERGQDPDRVVVCVMDADGRLSTGALAEVLPEFDDGRCGAVQLAVRIRNRNSFLTRFQDYQFWTLAAIGQFGRGRIDTVSLGGNGQFARLSVLNSVGERPWSGSLTEDLDLTVTLAVRGWDLRISPTAAVDQQAVQTVRSLVRQRTRWYQGHMMTARRLGEVWASPQLRTAQVLELTIYLLVPWIVDLPWSVLWLYFVVEFIGRASGQFQGGGPLWIYLATLALWYVMGFWPSFVSAGLYLKRNERARLRDAILLSHSSVVVSYVFHFCAWRAFFRIISGRGGWAKTERVAEGPTPLVVVGGWRPSDKPAAVPLRVPGRLTLSEVAQGRVPARAVVPGRLKLRDPDRDRHRVAA